GPDARRGPRAAARLLLVLRQLGRLHRQLRRQRPWCPRRHRLLAGADQRAVARRRRRRAAGAAVPAHPGLAGGRAVEGLRGQLRGGRRAMSRALGALAAAAVVVALAFLPWPPG